MDKLNGSKATEGSGIAGKPEPASDIPAFPNFERMRKQAPDAATPAAGHDIVGPFTRIPAQHSVKPPMRAARRAPPIPGVEALNDSGSSRPAPAGPATPA
ncbi:MAG TPA: hypothetical protein VLI06_14075 [Solimonas sp.]|nr:hypothetical protein [Solimonas sp.]